MRVKSDAKQGRTVVDASFKKSEEGFHVFIICHCEEQSDTTVSSFARRLLRFARNDIY
jgi:hypothetical protein